MHLNIDTFAYLPNLEELNLKHTFISIIQLGTFSYQQKLVTLDLSENHLKELDFSVFLPRMQDLRSLSVGINQLKEMKQFRLATFPQLISLDIKNNQFNCSYLQHFMEAINWEKLHLHVNPNSMNSRQTNIRGVNYKNIIQTEEDSGTNTSTDNIFVIKFSLVFICIIMATFLIMFLVLNRHRYFNQSTANSLLFK